MDDNEHDKFNGSDDLFDDSVIDFHAHNDDSNIDTQFMNDTVASSQAQNSSQHQEQQAPNNRMPSNLLSSSSLNRNRDKAKNELFNSNKQLQTALVNGACSKDCFASQPNERYNFNKDEEQHDSNIAGSHNVINDSNSCSKSFLKTEKIACPFCNIQLDSLFLIENHIAFMHSENTTLGNSAASINEENYDFKFVCPYCDLDLGDKETLDLHIMAIHEEGQDVEMLDQQICPLCGLTFTSENSLRLHIETHSSDQTVYGVSESSQEHSSSASTSNNMTCPVCELTMFDSDLLVSHVESHFNSKHNAGLGYSGSQQGSSKANMEGERNSTVKKNFTEHKTKQTGSQNPAHSVSTEKLTPRNSRENLSYKRQYEQNLEKAVVKGQISVADYHEQRSLMAQTDLSGVESGSTRTPGLIEKLQQLYHNHSRLGQVACLCSPVDHFAGSYGDKGWGCGYRNFQMLLSCLAKNEAYAQRIFADNNISIPSIPKIQQIIESAWRKGFDVQGSTQFNDSLVNTKKWIGATDIVAALSSLGVKCLIADFHAPSAPDGTHPVLMQWVSDHFQTHQLDFTPPLFLQHQGHSRTIVGVEKEGGMIRFLLFDPATAKNQMNSIGEQLSWKHMHLFRRTQSAFKSKQYQIIAIVGLLRQDEYEESKILKSVRVY